MTGSQCNLAMVVSAVNIERRGGGGRGEGSGDVMDQDEQSKFIWARLTQPIHQPDRRLS